jgi:hypothetical protein
MATHDEGKPPRLSRSERRRLEEEERKALLQWVEDKKDSVIFQQTLREYGRRRGCTVEYDPNDKDSVWKVLQSQPDYDLFPESGFLSFINRHAHRLIMIVGGLLVLLLMFIFFLTLRDPGNRKFPDRRTMIYR